MLNIKEYTEKKILVFDGAMGTMIQRYGLRLGELPELLNLTDPEKITQIHKEYVSAGADVVTANTFQANEFKLDNVEEVIAAGISCAKASGARWVALDVGPLGQLLEPVGMISFEQAYDAFARQIIAGKNAGADLIIFETFSDLYEMKAALLAAKENCDLPVICSMTFQEDGRTFLGCDPLTMTVALNDSGADAIGINCSLGPEKLLPVVEKILEFSKLPVIVQANAGLPDIENGETVFKMTSEDYAGAVLKMVKSGVKIVGGCCGTSPEFIASIVEKIGGLVSVNRDWSKITACSSGQKTVVFDGATIEIGERLNPTGKKRLQAALKNGDMSYILSEAVAQVNAGANVLDVNVGLPDIDEKAVLANTIKQLQAVTTAPLQIDSASSNALEQAARVYNGKPILNSVNGKAESMEKVFPIAKKYGALVIALTLDESGIPPTAEGRLEIAKKILKTAQSYDIPKENIIIDCLVLTASAQQSQVIETLRAIKLVKSELGVKTVLGVSNVSFGLPQREVINAAFLAAALGAGLDSAIINPMSERYREVLDAFRVLSGEDAGSKNYVEKYSQIAVGSVSYKAPNSISAEAKKIPEQAEELNLNQIIKQGRKELSADCVKKLLLSESADKIIDDWFVPALNEVGRDFESGAIFLPQLMLSAQAVQEGFEVIARHTAKSGVNKASKGKIILATVYGDIHDIGKNIVKMLLQNYGYDVIDLGRDVPHEAVVEAIKKHEVRLVGLSALMTTTVKSMKDTIAAVRAAGITDCEFMVGGAVLNEEYKEFVGAQYYARDAMESVRIAEEFFKKAPTLS